MPYRSKSDHAAQKRRYRAKQKAESEKEHAELLWLRRLVYAFTKGELKHG